MCKSSQNNYLTFKLCFLILASVLVAPLIFRKTEIKKFGAPKPTVFIDNIQYVAISGEVKHPGLYPISANNMTKTVIKMAEPSGVCNNLNLLQQQEIVIESGDRLTLEINAGKCTLKKGSMTTGERLSMHIKIPISEIKQDDLEQIPGVGVVMATRIVEYRHKNGGKLQISDLQSIEGIGEHKFKEFSKLFK